MRALTSLLFPIHPDGYKFIGVFAALTFLLYFISDFLGNIGLILTLWCAWFFRDPARTTPQREGLVISPADGVVNMIADAVPPPELGLGLEMRPRISVFMNLFNMHVNRMPVSGTVRKSLYRTGQFLNADLDKASEANERQSLLVETENGQTLVVVQIAGLVARRVLCFVHEDQSVTVGERFGLIRFGSRCDVYLPVGAVPMVSVGQTAIAGETVLADLDSDEALRETLTE
ncbi:MAG: phosphatidylserine decarboxylase [Rhizobiales bacterium TMED83]|jgi:phosphatidylserine decarboxylase|nr:phosphatidylserine decarboxylase family protein [Rhodobiaceae bacterium]RPF94660.1 MAG: phosphatidylserine decarboxylase [Rhizobiales bacterium TMED83]